MSFSRCKPFCYQELFLLLKEEHQKYFLINTYYWSFCNIRNNINIIFKENNSQSATVARGGTMVCLYPELVTMLCMNLQNHIYFRLNQNLKPRTHTLQVDF